MPGYSHPFLGLLKVKVAHPTIEGFPFNQSLLFFGSGRDVSVRIFL